MSVEKCRRSRLLGDQLRQARLVDRDLAALEARDLVGIDVDAVDLVAQLGEPRRRDQADVAGADDADRLAFGAHEARQASGDLGADAESATRAQIAEHLLVR